MEAAKIEANRWWKEGVCYQVWPLSFKDSNGDGNGDIRGLISKLDYLRDLGVDYIWMSPMYTSPREDYGYDIADYESVDPTFGNLQDMDDLIAGLKSRGMRLILDLVVNHTSSQHRWFKESAKSKDNEYSNYYIWRDPKIVDGKRKPPNNWLAFFGGSAWEYVEARDQYYLRMFLKSMPDLNWEEETVRRAIYKTSIEFWLERGVSGFRVDVVACYSKTQTFPDAPIVDPENELQPTPREMIVHGPREHEFLQEQRATVIDKYGPEIVLVGELGTAPTDHKMKYLSPVTRELDMVFDFEIFKAGGPKSRHGIWTEWVDTRSMKELRKGLMVAQSYIGDLGLWATTFFENHDQPRSISNFGSRNPKYHWQSGKLLALTLASMSGTLFIYQGQEIGMSNFPRDWDRSEYRDPYWLDFLETAEKRVPDNPELQAKAFDIFYRNNRDHARTPVQWTAEEPYAGWSTAKPWIRINENHKDGVNVQDQLGQPDSLLNFWRQLLKFRKSHVETMIYAPTKFVDNENDHIMSVVKQSSNGQGKSMLVVMNYSDEVRALPSLEQLELKGNKIGAVLFGTGPGSDQEELQPWEGRIFELL